MGDLVDLDARRSLRAARERLEALSEAEQRCDACGLPFAEWSALACSSAEGYHRHSAGANLLAQGQPQTFGASLPAGTVFNVRTTFGPDGQMRFERE